MTRPKTDTRKARWLFVSIGSVVFGVLVALGTDSSAVEALFAALAFGVVAYLLVPIWLRFSDVLGGAGSKRD